MPDRKVEVRRTGKPTLLAAGTIAKDGTVQAFVAGNPGTFANLDELEATCADLSSTGVDVVVTP